MNSNKINVYTTAMIGANYINDNYKKLSFKGYAEAILFFCAAGLTIDHTISESFEKEHNIIKEEFPELFKGFFQNKEDLEKFIESRIYFYIDELRMFEFVHYTPVIVYNAFYNRPLTRDVDEFKVNAPPLETLFMFQAYLKSVSSLIEQLKE